MFPFIVLSQQIDFYVHKHIFIAAMGRMQAQTFWYFPFDLQNFRYVRIEKNGYVSNEQTRAEQNIANGSKWKIDWYPNPHVGTQNYKSNI